MASIKAVVSPCFKRSLQTILLLSVSVGLSSCLMLNSQINTAAEGQHDGEIELADFMSPMQRFSHKLGYAVLRKNTALSEFYTHEIEEILEFLKENVDTYDEIPIAKPISVIMDPLLEALRQNIEASDWGQAKLSYNALVDGCNRCHAATEHEFIKILPSQGEPPYNQDFSPQS